MALFKVKLERVEDGKVVQLDYLYVRARDTKEGYRDARKRALAVVTSAWPGTKLWRATDCNCVG
jgi:hypothetical protein